jgi:hypothetical protein
MIDVRKTIVWVASGLLLLGLLSAAAFFADVNALEGPTAGDTAIFAQGHFNMMHGHPFSGSVFNEDSRQFRNPSPFLSQLVWHGYFLSNVVISPLYALNPTPAWLFTLFILLNFAGIAVFTGLSMRLLASEGTWLLRSALAIGILAGANYLRGTVMLAVPSTLAGPIVLAMVYFAWRRKSLGFLISAAALALLQDDLALDVCTFAAYLMLFERAEMPRRFKVAVIAGGVGALAYFAGWVFWLQPMVRIGLEPAALGGSSMLSFRIAQFGSQLGASIAGALAPRGLVRAFGPAAVFGLFALAAGLATPRLSARTVWKRMALVFIGGGTHWSYALYTHGERHSISALAFAFAGMLLFVADVPLTIERERARRAGAILALACAASLGLTAVGLPHRVARAEIVALVRPDPGTRSRLDEIARERTDGLRVIEYVNSLPPQRSVTLWANRRVEAFVANRYAFWLFPFMYDQADYVVVEPSTRRAVDMKGRSLDGSSSEFYSSISEEVPIDTATLTLLKARLTGPNGRYRIVRDEPSLLVLEREGVETPTP